MAILDKIGEEKQRVSERLARLDAERARLADRLSELEIAERVLTEFGTRGAENKAPKGKLGGDSAGRWRAERAGPQANGYSGGARRRPEDR